jgi:hypothetical protein
MENEGSIHQWIYVIIPTDVEHRTGLDTVIRSRPLFSAFCKACRTYFTQVIGMDQTGKGVMTPSELPRYGCHPIDDTLTVAGL